MTASINNIKDLTIDIIKDYLKSNDCFNYGGSAEDVLSKVIAKDLYGHGDYSYRVKPAVRKLVTESGLKYNPIQRMDFYQSGHDNYNLIGSPLISRWKSELI